MILGSPLDEASHDATEVNVPDGFRLEQGEEMLPVSVGVAKDAFVERSASRKRL